MAGTAGIFTGMGWSSLHLVLSAGMGIPVISANTGMELITMPVPLT
jgi:hypothetical protein